MSQIYKAFAVVGNDPDALSVASTDGVQLAVYANEPSAVEAMRQDSEAVVKVVMMTQGTYDALQGMISAVPERLAAELADAHNLVRFLAKLYCELDTLRYKTMAMPEGEIVDFMINNWPVVQGTANQIRLMRLSEMPYDSSKLAAAVEAALAAKTEVAAGPEAAPVNQVDGL
ncbi:MULTISPECIES: hypothetical protein [Pseudomonas]|uniref:Uncharacterized protein n=1 Tax=Pseudomonas lutea TaxID=243924 RepID=A0A9X8MH65_9PSED|nr:MULTISPECIES: hypothetical protein [Pseudomonas]SER37769.1 hypothetical protein SAMN05216409_118110 [Pseudomonas lutea]